MAQTKAQLLGPVVGDVVMDVSTLSLDAEGNKVGIGHSEPDLTLHVSGVNGLPSSSGSTPTGHLTIRNKAGSSHGMFLGVSDASPWGSWIQAQDASNNATNYPLLLNPNGGNVGIGTDNPGALIHINKASGTTVFKVSTQANSTIGLEIEKTGSTTQSWRIVDGQTVNGALEFYDVTNSTTRMIIRNGNVGIGTASPSGKLHVVHSGSTLAEFSNPGVATVYLGISGQSINYYDANTQIIRAGNSTTEYGRWDSSGRLLVGPTSTPTPSSVVIQGNSTGSTSYGLLRLTKGSTTPADGDALGLVAFGDSNHNTNAQITSKRDGGTWNSGSSHPTRLEFNTTADGDSGSTERLRIDSVGKLLIGPGAIANPKVTTIGAIDTSNADWAIVMGGSGSGNRADAANKDGRFAGAHYTNAEEPIGLVRSYSTSSANEVHIGGGSSLINAATQLSFYTASNTTTTGGTERLLITSDGNVGISDTAPRAGLSVRKYGSKFSNDSSTYYQPSGRIYTLVGAPANGEDSWFGMCGGYNNSSGSVNLLLQQNFNNTSQQAGCYIANEATAVNASVLTFGHMYASSSVTGRPSKTERLRIGSNGQIGMGKVGSVTVNGNSPLTIIESDSNAETICVRATNSGGNGSQPGIVFKKSDSTHLGALYADVNQEALRFSTNGGGNTRILIDKFGNTIFNGGLSSTTPITSGVGNAAIKIRGKTVSASSTTVDLNIAAADSTAGVGLEISESSNAVNALATLVFNHGSLKSMIASSRAATNQWGTDLRFYTHPNDTNSANQHKVYERMRIYESGQVTIGNMSAGSHTLSVNGPVRIGGGDYGSTTVLSVAPGAIQWDTPGVSAGRLHATSSGNWYLNGKSYPLYTSNGVDMNEIYGASTASTVNQGNWVSLGSTQHSSPYPRKVYKIAAPNSSSGTFVYQVWFNGDANYEHGGLYEIRINNWNESTRFTSVAVTCINGHSSGLRIYAYNTTDGIWVTTNSIWGSLYIRKFGYDDSKRSNGSSLCAVDNNGPLAQADVNGLSGTIPSGYTEVHASDSGGGGYDIENNHRFGTGSNA